jgi:hypothetical protein
MRHLIRKAAVVVALTVVSLGAHAGDEPFSRLESKLDSMMNPETLFSHFTEQDVSTFFNFLRASIASKGTTTPPAELQKRMEAAALGMQNRMSEVALLGLDDAEQEVRAMMGARRGFGSPVSPY